MPKLLYHTLEITIRFSEGEARELLHDLRKASPCKVRTEELKELLELSLPPYRIPRAVGELQ